MAIAQIFRAAPPEGARQLFLLFADAGQPWHQLAPLGEALAAAFPQAGIVILQGPHALAEGGCWLVADDAAGEQGVSPLMLATAGQAGLDAAVERALPGCIGSIRAWQAQMKVLPEATALVGVGEGATMVLAAALTGAGDGHPVCGRVSTVGGRFASLPAEVDATLLVHLLHGKADVQVHFGETVRTAEALVKQGADVVADIVSHEGSQLGGELIGWLLDRLQKRVPQHLWKAAMRVADDAGANGCG